MNTKILLTTLSLLLFFLFALSVIKLYLWNEENFKKINKGRDDTNEDEYDKWIDAMIGRYKWVKIWIRICFVGITASMILLFCAQAFL